MYPYASVSDIADWAQIVGVLVAGLALGIALVQLRTATKALKRAASAAEAEAVPTLDQTFAQFEELRDKLTAASEESKYAPRGPKEEATLSRYLVVFERLGLLVKKRLMPKRLALDLYGYALSRVLSRSNAQEIIRKEVTEPVPGRSGHSERRWENLIPLWKELRDGPAVPEEIMEAHDLRSRRAKTDE
jgi:hypothetical protein